MHVGYARVSTLDQNPQLQIDALKQAGCERLYVEKASGAHRDRPELKAALAYMRPGDTLVVWQLSRLARSLKQIIETAHELEQKKARKRGRKGGRPPAMDKEKTRAAEAMLKDTVNYPFVGDVIDHLRIGRTAFYRYFPPDRIRQLRKQA